MIPLTGRFIIRFTAGKNVRPNKGLHLTSARWQVARELAGEAQCYADR